MKIQKFFLPQLRFIKSKIDKTVVLTVIVLVILGDILFISRSSDFRIFTVLGLYGLSVLFYKIESRFTFLFCLAILGIMYLAFILTGTSEKTEKAAVWLFLLLAISIIQKIKER